MKLFLRYIKLKTAEIIRNFDKPMYVYNHVCSTSVFLVAPIIEVAPQLFAKIQTIEKTI